MRVQQLLVGPRIAEKQGGPGPPKQGRPAITSGRAVVFGRPMAVFTTIRPSLTACLGFCGGVSATTAVNRSAAAGPESGLCLIVRRVKARASVCRTAMRGTAKHEVGLSSRAA